MSSELEFTGERYVPGKTEPRLATCHEHRYQIALEWCAGRNVVDFGSGAGYGAALLSSVAASVMGYEPDREAVDFAQDTFGSESLHFTTDVNYVLNLAGKVDVVTCFEVLEHVLDPAEILSPVRELLTDQGVLLLSTPNRLKYQDLRRNDNPFHVHEYYFEELHETLLEFFPQVEIFGQDYVATSVVFPLSNATPDARLVGPGLSLAPVSDGFFALCSGQGVLPRATSFFLPQNLDESDDCVDGLGRTALERLLKEMEDERRRAQVVLDGWEADIERLNAHIAASQQIPTLVKTSLKECQPGRPISRLLRSLKNGFVRRRVIQR